MRYGYRHMCSSPAEHRGVDRMVWFRTEAERGHGARRGYGRSSLGNVVGEGIGARGSGGYLIFHSQTAAGGLWLVSSFL